jgi:hypothetical protein
LYLRAQASLKNRRIQWRCEKSRKGTRCLSNIPMAKE